MRPEARSERALSQLPACGCGAAIRNAPVSVAASTWCWTDSLCPSCLLSISECAPLLSPNGSPQPLDVSSVTSRAFVSTSFGVLPGLRSTVAYHGRDPSRRVAPMCLIMTRIRGSEVYIYKHSTISAKNIVERPCSGKFTTNGTYTGISVWHILRRGSCMQKSHMERVVYKCTLYGLVCIQIFPI